MIVLPGGMKLAGMIPGHAMVLDDGSSCCVAADHLCPKDEADPSRKLSCVGEDAVQGRTFEATLGNKCYKYRRL